MNTVQVQINAVGIPLGDEHRVFGFEADFAQDLRCIPMVVRFKLDRCGIKLSLKQWSRFGRENRAALLIRRCDTAKEAGSYRETLIDLVETCGGGGVAWLAPDPAPVWAEERQVPLPVVEQAARSGIAPPLAGHWARLAPIERFALVKLARSNHDNDNFLPAMREFGLIP
ncbi:MAG TPA: nitrate reductase associated protein [Hyphomonadaceae bacterium]|jgi:hypothetical protein|nr:nitrate reductase associated protein [Hyphomonadaceae bacterium]